MEGNIKIYNNYILDQTNLLSLAGQTSANIFKQN